MKIVKFLMAALLTATAVGQGITDAKLQEPRVTAEARMKTLLELEQKLIADWRKAVDEA